MAKLRLVWRLAFALLVAAATVWSFRAAPTQAASGWGEPNLARLIFFHLPCALTTSVLLFAAAYLSFRFLKERMPVWDIRAVACMELGGIFAVLTMVTGIIFSRVQWNAWWHWDPRQTSFLMVLLLYAAYFVLRMAFADETKRAVNSAGYSVAAVIPGVFLIFVFPRLPHVLQRSLHPTETIQKGQLVGEYRILVYGIFALMLVLSFWIYRLRVRAGVLEWEALNEGMDDRGDRAATGVVRPVSVPPES